MTDDTKLTEIPDDVEEVLRLQDEALALLERLRAEEPFIRPHVAHGGGRRDFRRWPTPPGVVIELHNGLRWVAADCLDLGVGGARVEHLPTWVRGPVPGRLVAPGIASAVLVLCDVMWKDGAGKDAKAGVRFEFQDEEERELWSGALIDALLARHALN